MERTPTYISTTAKRTVWRRMVCALVGGLLLAASARAASPTWTYDNSAKTLTSTDGWSFGVESWTDGRLILNGKLESGPSMLDLTQVGSAVGATACGGFARIEQKTSGTKALFGATAVRLPDTVTTLGQYAFAGATLEGTQCFDHVRYVTTGAFSGCSKMTSLVLGALGQDKVTLKGGDVSSIYAIFPSCSALTNVTIRAVDITLGNQAFTGAAKLKDVWLRASGSILISGYYNFESAPDDLIVHLVGAAHADVGLAQWPLGRNGLTFSISKTYH